jgi:hypothetical protein
MLSCVLAGVAFCSDNNLVAGSALLHLSTKVCPQDGDKVTRTGDVSATDNSGGGGVSCVDDGCGVEVGGVFGRPATELQGWR